jgi:hypothetical protein
MDENNKSIMHYIKSAFCIDNIKDINAIVTFLSFNIVYINLIRNTIIINSAIELRPPQLIAFIYIAIFAPALICIFAIINLFGELAEKFITSEDQTVANIQIALLFGIFIYIIMVSIIVSLASDFYIKTISLELNEYLIILIEKIKQFSF